MADPNGGNGWRGFAEPGSPGNDYNAISFVVQQLMARMSTAKWVKVIAARSNGEEAQSGTVDVVPLINQVDGNGNGTPQPQLYQLAYFRLFSGTNAVIMDPTQDDIGLAIFCDRDSSALRNNVINGSKDAQNPGSFRMFDLADGVYIGGLIGPTPTQFLRFYPGGIKVKTPGTFTIDAPHTEVTGTMHIAGAVTTDATIAANGEITAKAGGGDSVTLTGHTHQQGADSHGDTEQPTNPATGGT